MMFGHSSVKRLMSYRKSNSNGRDQHSSEEIHWSEKVIKNLVKKLKSSEINKLEHALNTKNQYTKCICIPRWVERNIAYRCSFMLSSSSHIIFLSENVYGIKFTRTVLPHSRVWINETTNTGNKEIREKIFLMYVTICSCIRCWVGIWFLAHKGSLEKRGFKDISLLRSWFWWQI